MLSDVHRAYLNGHAVSDAVIDAQGIRSDGDFIVFPWRHGDLRAELVQVDVRVGRQVVSCERAEQRPAGRRHELAPPDRWKRHRPIS